jgi:LmbE family N-acetylglucosaminyl deacetylase
MPRTDMKILYAHAHFDDYEFTAAGTFEMWKRRLGNELRAKVIVCADGRAGHHFRTRDEMGGMRLKEQLASAKIGGYEFESLHYPNGEVPREACLQVTTDLLAALWKAIRDFEPDYLFCPPLPADPLAGIHVDHVAVAEAVRKVAYLINVPHAFTPEFPTDETIAKSCKVPVILTVYDGYMFGANSFDFAVDVEEAFPKICEMAWCHQSQIMEWLPWVGRHRMETPKSFEDWPGMLRRRYQRHVRELGIKTRRAVEVFTVTAWGEVPSFKQLLNDFPKILPGVSNLSRLKRRLAVWQNH